MLEIKYAIVVVVLIFLKHYNGMCEQMISSSQLCFQYILCMNLHAHVTVHANCEDPLKAVLAIEIM